MKSALIDLAALECLDAFPRDLDQLCVVVQISPMRRDALRRTFPGAEIVEAWPPGDGPWQEVVEASLASLATEAVDTQGVPLLDCFREAWRGELERVAVATLLLEGECWLAAGSTWVGSVRELARQRTDIRVRSVSGQARGARWSPARLKGLSGRGLRMALTSRLDPSGLRRSRLSRQWRAGAADSVIVSSYVNTTRAAVRLWREVSSGPALFPGTGPGASAGLTLPEAWRRATPPDFLRHQRRAVEKEIARCRAVATSALRDWSLGLPDGDTLRVWPAIKTGAFGRRFLGVHLPEVVATIAALRHAVESAGARQVLTSNEFSFCDRAALLLARAITIKSEACQHGVIDGHYRRDRILADRYWCWSDDARDLMLRWGAAAPERLATLSGAPVAELPADLESRRTIVLFTQPYELVPLRREDLLDEVIPAIDRAAHLRGWSVTVRIHPLESTRAYRERLTSLARWSLAGPGPLAPILHSARAAVVLDSSVVVDCRRHGVPCLGIGWYPGNYGSELEAMGYLGRAAAPAPLEVALLQVA